jgi:hypothetical protein
VGSGGGGGTHETKPTFGKTERGKRERMGRMSESIYVGSGKIVQREGKESFMVVQLDLTELAANKPKYEEFVKKVQFKDGEHRLLNLIVAPMKPENQKTWKTHSVKIDTWKPEPKGEENQDEIPF